MKKASFSLTWLPTFVAIFFLNKNHFDRGERKLTRSGDWTQFFKCSSEHLCPSSNLTTAPYTHGGAQADAHTWRSEQAFWCRPLSISSSLPWDGVSHWTRSSPFQLDWLIRKLYSPLPTSHPLSPPGLQAYIVIPNFYVDAGDLNLGPQACKTSPLIHWTISSDPSVL